MRPTHHDRRRTRQNADPFSKNRPFSAIFAQWVCTLAAISPQVAGSRHQSGGIARHGGPTRRRHAARRLRVVQNPRRRRCGGAEAPQSMVAGPTGAGRAGVVSGQGLFRGRWWAARRDKIRPARPLPTQPATKFAQQPQKRQIWGVSSAQGELFRAQPHHHRCVERRRVQTAWPRCPWAAPGHCHSPPTGTRTTPEHDIIRPTTTTPGLFRYKTLPAHPPSPHVRYKTLPARATRPHFRYKTLPARPKWLNLALFLHAGRVLYRCHHQEAEQGEFCTEREAEIE